MYQVWLDTALMDEKWLAQGKPASLSHSALCGYPLVKVPVEKICSFAPILLRFDYFRQNIWRLFFAQFHF